MTAGGWLFVSLVTLALAGVVALYLHRRRLAREKARLEAQALRRQNDTGENN
jgi:hypothetical protein